MVVISRMVMEATDMMMEDVRLNLNASFVTLNFIQELLSG